MTLHTAVATRAGLMRYHDPERIQGYCRSCEKHGRYWSCPPFERPPMDGFPQWSHAVIVCGRTILGPGTTKESMMERFYAARLEFGAHLLRVEALRSGVTALVAGHCPGCVTCTRPEGKPCRAPERMRHSPEALGFDVSALAEGLAGQKIHWPKQGLPESLLTVGALLCGSVADAELLNAEAGLGGPNEVSGGRLKVASSASQNVGRASSQLSS